MLNQKAKVVVFFVFFSLDNVGLFWRERERERVITNFSIHNNILIKVQCMLQILIIETTSSPYPN